MNFLHTKCCSKLRHFLTLILLAALPISSHAQLPDFSLDVAVTDESCAGNGTMTFTVSNTTPGATIEYNVYLQPDLTVPVASTTTNFVGGRSAGIYTVIALQTLNGESNSATEVVEIKSIIVDPLTYLPVAESRDCNGGNTITIDVLTGMASLYEILSGPVTAPPQASNVFTGLVDGTYIIRVYDQCGQGVSTTFTPPFDPQPPVFSDPVFVPATGGDCSTVRIQNTMSYPEGTVISYPLTISYVIHPSDGTTDITSTQTINSGNPGDIEFGHTFPYQPDVTYTYTIDVVNGCGNTFNSGSDTFNPAPSVTLTKQLIPCGMYFFNLAASDYNASYTVNFLSPPGFDPASYNATYPGSYNNDVIAFGGSGQSVPEGIYTVTITDACNRTSLPFTLDLKYDKPIPSAEGYNSGCFSDFGRIIASIPDRKIVTAVITAAPGGYPEPLEDDVSDGINTGGVLLVTNVPLGDYVLTLTDDCGIVYTDVKADVPEYDPIGFESTPLADCTIGIGSVIVTSGNGKLVSMSMTAAPAGYPQPLPYNVSAFIDAVNGKLYMDGLPQGNYTFSGTDVCGIIDSVNAAITGYVPGTGVPFTFVPLCNSFDIAMSDTDTSSLDPTYWLQRENPDVPGQWMHPDTDVVYPEGTVPNTANSVALENIATNYNLQFSGNFRIIKAFESVSGAKSVKVCVSPIGDTFEYYDNVQIANAYTLGCSTRPDDVFIEAVGQAPLNYSIVDPNDVNITILDNGTSSVFTNLPAGIYTFKVENQCGTSKTATVDVATLPDLVNAGTPNDVAVCVQPGESLFQEFNLTGQNAVLLNGGSPTVYSVRYYLDYNEANSGINEIQDPEHFVNTSNQQDIYARVDHMLINLCHDIKQFKIGVGEIPELTVDEDQYLCEGVEELILTAGEGFDTYLWSPGGETTASIAVTVPGEYTVQVTNSSCPNEATITVLPVGPPKIISIDIFDWTEDNNGFTVNINSPELYEYSVDNITFQESNTFSGLLPGLYEVYVRDRQQCNIIEGKVALLNYPKYFTPNGDGTNETWRIEYAWMERGMMTYIYDRYGKLITSINPQSDGWDGRLNGANLPATDYWFVVNREDGRIYKGHFSLLR